MPFKPGRSGNQGRSAGKRLRRLEKLYDKLEALNYDPLEELVKCATHPDADQKTKAAIAREIMPYAYPIPKPVGDDGDLDPIVLEPPRFILTDGTEIPMFEDPKALPPGPSVENPLKTSES